METEPRAICAWRLVGSLLPVVYVWSLPLLGVLGFAHKCPDWPRCGDTGASVSSFIANAHATGAMAGCFFYPALQMWLNAQQVEEGHRCIYPTLIAFQACFGIFLACPITEVPWLHAMAVNLFCMSALTHSVVVLRHCAIERLWHCQALLCVSILGFATVFVLALLSKIWPHLLIDNCPLLFYFAESSGLSAMAFFPFLWDRERLHVEQQRTMSNLSSTFQETGCFRSPMGSFLANLARNNSSSAGHGPGVAIAAGTPLEPSGGGAGIVRVQ